MTPTEESATPLEPHAAQWSDPCGSGTIATDIAGHTVVIPAYCEAAPIDRGDPPDMLSPEDLAEQHQAGSNY